MCIAAEKTHIFVVCVVATPTLSLEGWTIFEVLDGIFKGGVFMAHICHNSKTSFFKGGVLPRGGFLIRFIL